jgi:hypothetical protein
MYIHIQWVVLGRIDCDANSVEEVATVGVSLQHYVTLSVKEQQLHEVLLLQKASTEPLS